MKDKQGIVRGKCNSCECAEYIAPGQDSETEKPLRVRCDYCNHTPVEHVRIIPLGKCRGCPPGNCEEYESDDLNSYTDCSYCACPARLHAGAEKPETGIPVGVPGVVLRHDESGNPVQTTHLGRCQFPGCRYPRRTEKGHVFDYCSKTCADKAKMAVPPEFNSTRNSSNMQPQTGFSTSGVGQVGSSVCPQSTAIPGSLKSMIGRSKDPTINQASSMSSQMSFQGPSSCVCSKCQKNPPNRGRKWCESCYISSLKQSKP